MGWENLEEDIAEEMGELRLDLARSVHGISTYRKTEWFDSEIVRGTRSAAIRAGNAKRPKELRVEIARNARRKQLAATTPEQRSASRKKQHDRTTPEQRSEIARRGAATRKARRAA